MTDNLSAYRKTGPFKTSLKILLFITLCGTVYGYIYGIEWVMRGKLICPYFPDGNTPCIQTHWLTIMFDVPAQWRMHILSDSRFYESVIVFTAIGFIVGLITNILRFLYRMIMNTNSQLKRRAAKSVENAAKQKIQNGYQSRISQLPAHQKVGNAMACNNENGHLYVNDKQFMSDNYVRINYIDIVSWRETWDANATTREALIGTKTVVTETNNAIVLTLRGSLGPRFTVHISSSEWWQECSSLLSANLS